MSDRIVQHDLSPDSHQQGSVDWMALSNQSLNFSVAALARLSKADIDPYTLQVGQALCSNFRLQDEGQKRISEAITTLKEYQAYGEVMSFGFGMKHVVVDLAETEEGMTLVALCATLATTYDSIFAARVLGELCVLCEAPQTMEPALRQWENLVELCSGILMSGQLPLLLSRYRQLMLPSHVGLALRDLGAPTKPRVLAMAIMTIGHVSRLKAGNAAFSGGLNCAWLAALAVWVFSLDVEIYDEYGLSLCRSGSDYARLTQIEIIFNADHDNAAAILERHLRFRKALFQSIEDEPIEKLDIYTWFRPNLWSNNTPTGNLLNWRAPWATILGETFGKDFDVLSTNSVGEAFKTFLYCVSLSEAPGFSRPRLGTVESARHQVVEELLHTQKYSCGRPFLGFAMRRLPELCGCLQGGSPIVPHGKALRLGFQALIAIESHCQRHPVTQSYQPNISSHSFCLGTLAVTIVYFLWITLVTEIEDDIYPSTSGLKLLYHMAECVFPLARTQKAEQSSPTLLNSYINVLSVGFPVKNLNLIFQVLTGMTYDRWGGCQNHSNIARAGAGLCVYRCAMEDPRLPIGSIHKIRVVRGYITHTRARYRAVDDMLKNQHSYSLNSGIPRARASATPIDLEDPDIEALVQEAEDETKLRMAFRVRLGTADYWLNIAMLLRKLRLSTKTLECWGGCSALNEWKSSSVDLAPWIGQRLSSMVYDSKTINRAQALLNDVGTSGMWVLALRPSTPAGDQYILNVDSHFSMYLRLVSDVELVRQHIPHNKPRTLLFRFTNCLSCMFEHGCWDHILWGACSQNEDEIKSWWNGSTTTLILPNSQELEIKWSRPSPESAWQDGRGRRSIRSASTPSQLASSGSSSGSKDSLSKPDVGTSKSSAHGSRAENRLGGCKPRRRNFIGNALKGFTRK